jgi:hypothetical protein
MELNGASYTPIICIIWYYQSIKRLWYISVAIPGLQNGAPDGLALVDAPTIK